jgi:hypothetical protein
LVDGDGQNTHFLSVLAVGKGAKKG